MMQTFAVRHPTRLEAEKVDVLSDDVAMVATDAYGNRVVIIASRTRWMEALMPTFGPKPSPAETAAAMYVRGEVEVNVLEAELDREVGRFASTATHGEAYSDG